MFEFELVLYRIHQRVFPLRGHSETPFSHLGSECYETLFHHRTD